MFILPFVDLMNGSKTIMIVYPNFHKSIANSSLYSTSLRSRQLFTLCTSAQFQFFPFKTNYLPSTSILIFRLHKQAYLKLLAARAINV